MKIKYRSNLVAGCFAIVAAIVLFFLIPSQVALESKAVHGITSRSLPYALVFISGGCGIGLIFQSLVLKKDEVKELELKKEAKGLLYMLVLLAYGLGFSHSFLISTSLLGVMTLIFSKDKKPLHYFIVVAVVTVLYFVFTRLLHVRLP